MSYAWNWLLVGSDGTQHGALVTLVRITLLLTIAWMCHCAWCRWHPQVRILLWRTVASGLIVVFCLSLTPYRWNLPLPLAAAKSADATDAGRAQDEQQEISSAVVGDPVTVAQQGESSPVGVTLPKQRLMPEPATNSVVESDAADASKTVDILPAAANVSSGNLSLYGWVVAIWVCGIVSVSWTWFVGILRLVSLYRRASAVPRDVQDQASAIAATLGYTRPVDIRHSGEIHTPCNVGAWRPRVLIPTRQCAVSAREELRASLAHELAHCLQHDLRWHHLFTILQASLWFHPMAWKIRVAHADACDELCDAKAAGCLGDEALYGRLLAGLALRVADPSSQAALAMARRSQVRKRIEAVSRNVASKGPGRWQAGGIVACAVLAVVLLGTVSITRSQAQPSRVEDVISGTGEPGATVQLYFYPDRNAPPVLKQETIVDANGRFSLGDVPTVGEKGHLELAATKPGFASVIRYVSRSDRSEIQLPMKTATAALSGTVSDANGIPVAGAVVTTQSGKNPISGVHMAVTNKNGRYHIDDLAEWNAEDTRTFDADTGITSMVSECYFSVIHADYAITRGGYSQIPQEVNITLLPPAIVEGQVVDLVTGEALGNVEVQAQGVGRSGWFTTKTDADGTYQLRMTNDHYNIWAVVPERMPLAIKALKVTQGRRLMGMDVRVTQGGFVVGKVLDPETNQPVDGSEIRMRVAHYGPARPKTGAAVTSTDVTADGTYRLHVAPGRNYVYLMSGNAAPVYLKVGDGQTVTRDFVLGSTANASLAADPDLLLGYKIREEARREDEEQGDSPPSEPVAATLRRNTSVGDLLTELEDMNTGPEGLSDAWANQLRRIVAVGPDAVPELIAELDRTSSDRMLRCLGFMLRAIGDERAVPGLIRAIPKTLRRSGSDLGLRIDGTDETLTRFMQQHDLYVRTEENEYGFGRPVREVSGALRSLTGQEFGEQELFSVFLNDNDFPSQKRAKAVLFHRVAERWAQWWQEHGHQFTDDPALHDVKLAPLAEFSPTDSVSADTTLKTDSGTGNWILESIRRAQSGRVFYDLDTGRAASLPKRWRGEDRSTEHLQEIQDWAATEGYDMMGDEIEGEGEKAVFVLRPIGLQTWELPETRWKDDLEKTSIAALRAEGRSNGQNLLLHFDSETNEFETQAPATFFYLTREGTPGILYVGIEVHDDSLKPGGVFTGDDELNPVAFRKGRRFGLSRLAVAE